MYWYCYFTKSGYEENALSHFKKQINSLQYQLFIPIIEHNIRASNSGKLLYKPLFPGYIFLRTDVSNEEIAQITHKMKRTKSIYYMLRYDEGLYAVSDSDRRLMMEILDDNYCLKRSVGVIEGDHVKINRGPLVGYESMIKKIDRHKKRAHLLLDLMGCQRTIEVGLEIIERIP